MDTISAALGLEYGSDEEMRALAERLRKEKRAADVFALSPTFEKQAAAQQQNIIGAAETAGLQRAKQRELESREEQNQLARENALNIAGLQAASRGQGYRGAKALWGGLGSSKEREGFKETAQNLARVMPLIDSWKPEYGPFIPGAGKMEVKLGEMLPFMPDSVKERVSFWKNFEELHNLIRRHNFFGSAFTKTEAQAWDKAMISENTQPEIASRKLNAILGMAKLEAQDSIVQAYAQGVDRGIIEAHYGGLVGDVDSVISSFEANPQQWREARIEEARGYLTSMLPQDEPEDTPAPGEATNTGEGGSGAGVSLEEQLRIINQIKKDREAAGKQ